MRVDRVLHVVAFTLRSDVTHDDPRAQAAAGITEAHPEHIPGIRSWDCGWDVSGRPDAVDYLLVATFDSVADYRTFQTHPDHERGKRAWREISTWHIADLLQESGASA